MRRSVLLSLCLVISGCAGSGGDREAPVAARLPSAPAADSTIVRRLTGQVVPDQPLLPQPGNIWADVLPAGQPGPPAATPGAFGNGHRPDAVMVSDSGSSHTAAPVVVAAVPAAARPAPEVSPAVAASPAATASVAVVASQVATTSPVAVFPAATARPPATALLPATALRPAVLPSPARPPAVLPPAVPASAVPATAQTGSPVASSLMVQLAAARSAQSAEAEWRRLRQQAQTLTEGHPPAVTEAEVKGQRVWRLRAAGFADVAEASAFCTSIRTVKANCWVVPPAASP